MKSNVLWIEIPVLNFKRAVLFYEGVLETKLEIRTIFDRSMALFSKEDFGIGGSLVEVENYNGGSGVKLIFYTSVLHPAMERVKAFGGEVVNPPALLRQKNKNGEIVIGTNLIDNRVGYYVEVKDTEGNNFYLYSHS